MLLFGMNCLLLPSIFSKESEQEKGKYQIIPLVHCHSLIYFLCPCLPLLKIISLNANTDIVLHNFMSVSYPSNSSYPSSFAIQFMALLPLLYFQSLQSRRQSLSMNVVVAHQLSHVQLLVTPWTAVNQACLFFTISWSLLKLLSIESVMPSKHLILCRPLLLFSVFSCEYSPF